MPETDRAAASASHLSNQQKFRRDYDFLSFLSVIVHLYKQLDVDLTFLSVFLDETAIHLRPSSGEGSYFSVTVTEGRRLLDVRPVNFHLDAREKAFPELVAIKSPNLLGDSSNNRNRKIWSSMAIELQILRNEHLSANPNVVSLLGICWQCLGANQTTVMPSFILEAALMDLEAFMVPGKACKTRKLLGLAIDIAAGVRAIHDVGIIHCDLKPKNILVFKDAALEYTAKISDFGSAMILKTVDGEVLPSAATSFWQAPECTRPLTATALIKADIYSLGLIVWNLVTANLAVTLLNAIENRTLDLGELTKNPKSGRLVGYLILESLKKVWGSPSPSASIKSVERRSAIKDRLLHLLLHANYLEAEARPSAKEILEQLRITLSEILIDQTFSSVEADEGTNWASLNSSNEFNPQEEEIWLYPGLDAPTEDDVERVMHFGKNMEFIKQTFDQIERVSFRLPSYEKIAARDAEKRVEGNLRCWKKEQSPRPDLQRIVRDGRAVVEADHSFGTLRFMPDTVVNHLYTQFRLVASDPYEERQRRAEAAYQFSVLSLGRFQTGGNNDGAEESLKMLTLAATFGHTGAQSMVGRCHEAFRKAPSFDQGLETSKWLLHGIKSGGLCAKRRLRSIDEPLYNIAMKKLRTRYGGVGMKLPYQYKDLPPQDVTIMLRHALNGHGGLYDTKHIFFFFAIAGMKAEVSQLLPVINVNGVNDWNETALLMACRAGHTAVAQLLLDAGADPAISSKEEVTPLHFLAAFEDKHIRDIAHQLLRHNAPIEARSLRGSSYRHVLDTTFGDVNGTPLMWAVAADSVEATRVLVELGADPFDEAAKDVPRSNVWGNVIHKSPVFHAATKHQYYLLEILLVDTAPFLKRVFKKVTRNDNKWRLNNNIRLVGTFGVTDTSSPLTYCATYSAEGLLKRILLHGKEYEIAFCNTFEVLIRAGADPENVDGEGTSVMAIAVPNGQPFAVHFLMAWHGGLLRPSPQKWLQYLLYTVTTSDRLMFDTLMQYSMIADISEHDYKASFGTISRATDDLYFIEPLRDGRKPEEDYANYLASALQHGYPNVAKWFYMTGRCDISVQNEETSILGMFLLHSKAFTTFGRAIDLILGLDDLPEEVFYNNWEFNGSQFSALHVAVFNLEYVEGAHIASWTIEKVVAKWNEPHHLNYQIGAGFYKGFTPLHAAVWSANVSGVRYLLEQEGDSLDLDLLDADGRTAFDLALLLLRNQKPIMDSREVPPERQMSADEAHWRAALWIISLLRHHKVKHKKFVAAIARPEAENLTAFAAAQDWAIIQIPDAGKLFKMSPKELANISIFMQEAAKLSLCDAIFMLSSEAQANKTRKLSGESLLVAEQPAASSERELGASWTSFPTIGKVADSFQSLDLVAQSEVLEPTPATPAHLDQYSIRS